MIGRFDDYETHFDFETVLEGEDAKNFSKEASREICKFYLRGHCAKGKDCPFRHVRAEKAVVCKHWLRALCKKGDACEFLHEYIPKKMPECWFFAKYEECSNPECIFLHIRKEDKVKPCPWFNRGFCKHGPNCRLKHILRLACPDYLAGFCAKGPNCKFAHPKFDIPKDMQDHLSQNAEFGVRRKVMPQQQQQSQPYQPQSQQQRRPNGHSHQQQQHNPRSIPTLGQSQTQNNMMMPPQQQQQQQQQPYYQQQSSQYNQSNRYQPQDPNNPQRRSFDHITCHKCKQKGHYANACPNPRVPDDPMQF